MWVKLTTNKRFSGDLDKSMDIRLLGAAGDTESDKDVQKFIVIFVVCAEIVPYKIPASMG